MNPHSKSYRDLHIVPQQRAERLWNAAAIAVTAVVAVAGIGWMANNARQADAAKAAYLKSPIIMHCTDPLSGRDASVRAADVANIPGVIESAQRNFKCGPVLGGKTP